MRKYLTALMLAGPILLISIICCTPSLHPLYTNDDLVFKPELLGVWADVDEEGATMSVYEFLEQTALSTDPVTGSEIQSEFYKLRYFSEDKIGRFDAHLVALGEELFLDLYPTELDSYEMADLYQGHLIQAHTFLYVKEIGPRLIMGYFDSDWLNEYLADNPQAIAHDYLGQDEEQQLVFTAPTEDLQAFMLECLGQEEALSEDNLFDLKRVEDAELAALTVSVTRDGDPVFTLVSIFDADNAFYQEAWTDENGVSRFTGLFPGSYVVSSFLHTETDEYYSASQDVALEPGDDLQVELALTSVEGT